MSDNTNLIAAIKSPAVLIGNFDEVRAHFVEQLKQYDLVVTVDTLADAKKLATELNKAASEVKSRGKAVSGEAMAPIDVFNNQVKELAQLLLDARTKLTEQVKRFEDETRANALVALQAYLVEQGQAKGIRPEFQRASVDDLANLSTLTSTGKLASKAKSAVDERINTDLALQTQTDMRLLRLENDGYKAGLTTELSRAHVESFLFADEATYQLRLAALFEAELQREIRIKEAAIKRAADDKAAVERAEQRALQAERDRKEADRIRLEQQEKHDKEMAELRSRQVDPQPVVTPISMDIPTGNAPIAVDSQVELHAIGDVRYPSKSMKIECTFADACAYAANVQAERVAIWTKATGSMPLALLVKSEALLRQVLGAA